MNVCFENFGLYNVDVDYLRYLNSIEPEVQFSDDKDYEQKPFLGIVTPLYREYNPYFIIAFI